MPKKKNSEPITFEILSEEERLKYQAKMDEDYKRYQERKRKPGFFSGTFCAVFGAIRYAIFMPLSIAAKVVSALSMIGGAVLSIGMPYGFYRAFCIIKELVDGVEFADMNLTPIYLFIAIPIAAFFAHYVFSKLADVFEFAA